MTKKETKRLQTELLLKMWAWMTQAQQFLTRMGAILPLKHQRMLLTAFFFGRKDVFDPHLKGFGRSLARRYGPLSLPMRQLQPFHVALRSNRKPRRLATCYYAVAVPSFLFLNAFCVPPPQTETRNKPDAFGKTFALRMLLTTNALRHVSHRRSLSRPQPQSVPQSIFLSALRGLCPSLPP